jgi:hypothetical protein
VDVLRATFPGKQYLGLHSQLRLAIANVGDKTIPNLTVSISNSTTPGASGFDKRINDPNLADPVRPIWVLDRPPRNSEPAFTNTWAVGPLDPDRSRLMVWNVTAVVPGTYKLSYQVAAGLHGKAKAVLPDGSPAKGSLPVRITSRPLPVPDPIE